MIRLDAAAGTLEALVDEARMGWPRPRSTADLARNDFGIGRELFAAFRAHGRPRRGTAPGHLLPEPQTR